MATQGHMKIATWNVNGIRARAAQVCEWIEREIPDIICLQELKATADQIPLVCQIQEYHMYWHTLKAYSGVSLQIRKGLAADPVFSHPAFDFESRIVQATHGDVIVASAYVPNGGKDYPAKLMFMNRLIEWVRARHADGRSLILCGDMNIARTPMDVHPKETKPNTVGQLPEERDLFAKLLEAGLTDMGRKFDPDNPNLFTWWAPWRNLRQRNIGWRLDYVLASADIADRATSCVVRPEVGTSDHAPVVMEWK
jgi:exodeoxyribonuclease-3